MPDVTPEGLTPDSEEHLTLLSTSFPTRCVIPDTEHRAISLEQLRRVFDFASLHCRCWHDFFKLSPTVGQLLSIEVLNLYHLDAWLIRPATEAENCSMVELLAKKPQAPQWFISHWWGEAIKAFVGCVERHAEIRELPGTAGYWVCAYANRQHALSQELTADPRETSFFRALNLSQGVLLILDEATETSGPATPFTRIWCAFEEFVALSPRPGPPLLLDIAAAERGQSQLLTDGVAPADEEGARRLGAGYPAGKVRSDREKSFPLEVLRAGLTLELEKAKASQEEDRRHILNCIAGQDLHAEPLMESPSYTKMNQTLRAIFAVAGWRQAVERDIVEVLRLPETLGESEREELVLDFTGSVVLHDACAAPLAAALRAAPLRQTLRRLELSGRWCTEISHQFLIHLAPAIPQDLNSLTLRFGFAAKNIHQEGIEALAKAIPRTLTELFLDFSDGSRLGDESLKAIAASLPLSLERLTLGLAGWVNLTDHGLTALAQRLPQLTFLKIDCYIMSTRAVIGDLGLAALGEKLQKLEKLQQLDLSFKCNGTIGDGGLSALGAALPRSLSALRLVFDNCSKITDAGLAALAAGFPPGLEKLQLFCNDCGHLGDGALAALGSAPLEQLKHLELALNGARLSDAGLAAVRLRSASLSLLSLSLANAELRSGGVAALAQQLPSEVQALHLCLSGCEGLEDLALSALGENLNAELQSLTMSLDNCLKLSEQGLAGLAQKMPQLNTLRMYLSGCDGMGDAGYAALFQRLPKSLQMLELEPGGAFSAAGLCALQTALLERCDVQLRLDCSYTQVDEDLAAELIGPGGLATLRRWQPEVVAPDPAQPPKGPPARPSSPAPVPEKAAPTVLKVSEVIPQTLPSPRTFQEDMSDTKPRAPKAAAATKAAAVAKQAAKASPLSMCGAQVLRQPRQPPAGGLLQSAQASAKAKSRGVGASRSAVKL